MALIDPELLVAATSAVGDDVLSALFQGGPPADGQHPTISPSGTTHQPHHQTNGLRPHHTAESLDVLRMHQHEVEMAQLQQEVKATRKLIAEARRDAEEDVVAATVATARAIAKAKKYAEAAKQEEAKHAKIREDAAHATALAAEAAKLAAAQALAAAREQEHRMDVHEAIALKAQ